jgi:hypothetical protein
MAGGLRGASRGGGSGSRVASEAVDDSPREGPTAGGDRLPQLANGGGGGCRGDPVSLNLDCACRRPKYYMCRR